jgi:hypothetical protein
MTWFALGTTCSLSHGILTRLQKIWKSGRYQVASNATSALALENDLIGRVALSLDAKNPASKGLLEKALRAINPKEARNDGDAAAREARAKKILGDLFKGEMIAGNNVVPGLNERWGRPIEQQLAIKIPEQSFPAITEKIVRGLVFREDDAYIEPPQTIECFLAKEEGLDQVKEVLAARGKEFKREPGLSVRRAQLDGGDVYEITFWDQFKTYATVSKADDAEPAVAPKI